MEWVSVKEKLPEPHIDVLVYAGNSMSVRYYEPPRENYCWGWYPGGLPVENSSHWMPLPERPK